ncbi:MAG: DUF6531 domain-containing protein, partial [Acidiferrobacterales bacterium]
MTASIGLLNKAALADAVPLATEEPLHRYAASGAESKCLSADKWFLLDLLPDFDSARAAADWRARELCNLSGATLEEGCANLGNQWRVFGEDPEAQDATCKHGALGTVHFTVLGLRPFPKCPSGYVASGEECVPAGANDAKNNGEPKDCTGNPCNPATGNKYQAEEDYRSGDGTLSFVRHYNSHEGLIKNNRARKNVNLGVNWHANIDRAISLTEGETLTSATITRPDGKIYYHSFIGGVWQADSDVDPKLEQTASGWTYSLPDSSRETYDTAGRLVSETDRSGKTTTYGYDASGRLETVTGPFGHVLTLAYDPEGRLNRLTDPAGAIYVYDYDLNGNLSQVTYPDGTTRIYHYEKTSFPHHLTGITDENGDRFAIFDYSPLGNAILTEHAGGQERFNLRYDSNTRTTVTDAIGTVEVLTFAVNLGVKNLSSRINQTDGKGITQQFDENNNLIRRTDEEGRTTTFTYNAHNQRLSMTEGVGTPEERTTTFSYVSNDIDLPTEVITPSVAPGQQKRLTTVYDANNNPIRITESGFTPSGDAVSRTITMAYNAFGQVITIDGPRTDLVDITTLEYYECASGAECGQLKRITNAAGHMTTYDAYDAHGRVTRLTDPNGVVTAFTYDPRGRVTSITLTPPAGPARTTTNTYDGVGQLRRVTTPDGTTLTYAYDAAHDLRSITDNLGNRIEYDYDARGNRIAERIFDPDATLVRTIENQYDWRNRLEQINAAGSITQLLNDAVGNLIQQTDPNANPSTRHSYDALNRLFRTIDALSGITSYGYDVNDRLTQVTAPNNATTQYVYDDLGNPLREDSPDRGTRIHTYDAAGNLKTLTDPRGVTALYTYDALNRLTFIDYPNATEDVTFTYDVQGCTSAAGAGCAGAADTCPHGIGRLCAVQDESGTTRFSYDPYGNVIEQIHTELGISFTTAYTFDAADRVVSMTYPDGRLVRYTRDAIGRITKVTTTVNDDTTTLLDNVTYRADGLTTAQTFGNGLAETRLYDRHGRV